MIKKNSFTKFKIIIILFSAAILFFVFIFFKSGFFTIKQLEVKTELTNCTDENNLKDKSGILGQNFFLINEKKIKEKLKNSFFCIKDINFSKILPDKIKMSAVGRSPYAKLISINNWEASSSSLIENTATPTAKEAGSIYLADSEGVVFSKDDITLTLPDVYIFNQDLSVGIKLQDDYLKKTLKILEQLKNLGINGSQAYIFNNLFIVNYSPRIVFRLDVDINLQIASLQLILQKAKIDESRLEFIDLRFDKPLIKFAPKK